MQKKILLSLGSLAAFIAPIASVIACAEDDPANTLSWNNIDLTSDNGQKLYSELVHFDEWVVVDEVQVALEDNANDSVIDVHFKILGKDKSNEILEMTIEVIANNTNNNQGTIEFHMTNVEPLQITIEDYIANEIAINSIYTHALDTFNNNREAYNEFFK